MAGTSSASYRSVLSDMSSNEDKASAVELKEQIEMYERGIKKKRTVTKSEENPNGMLIPPEMGGKILVSILYRGKGHDEHVSAELSERGVEPPMEISKMKWNEVLDLLKLAEHKVLVERELARNIKHWSDVKEFEPQSEKMKELFDYQADHFLEKQSRKRGL